jgi:hypothetical protein
MTGKGLGFTAVVDDDGGRWASSPTVTCAG